MKNEQRPRFEGISKSYSPEFLAALKSTHVAIIGLGGVGSWAAETLVRSGVGTVTLMDMDELCLSNTNRQVHALEGTYGRPKIQVLSERFKSINPEITVNEVMDFFDESTKELLFEANPDAILDCIDSTKNKTLLIAECYQRKIPMVTCGGAGGKTRVEKIQVTDLNKTSYDPLLARVRKKLKREYRISKGHRNNLHIPCVFSDEIVEIETCDVQGQKLDCAGSLGSLMHITATMGIQMAGVMLNSLYERHTSD